MFAQQLVTMPQRDAPGGDFTEGLEIIALQRDAGPVRAAVAGIDLRFDGFLTRQISLRDAPQFKAQLERVPADQFPEDRRYNPRSINPYVLFKALPQVRRYTEDELVRAMDLLFQCNLRLVSSGTDASLLLQQTLVQIVGAPAPAVGRPRSLVAARASSP